ncbi:NADH:ubiquinone reductase (Na(+)-transporting) subunit F [Pseudonocardia sp. WMMC193]|uniref:NADH:ubiquinone reductase (Na(+)-transporting) subunit F n=1 Tax=Pseudonocardia sp. WMMC193 TaxID=2911965 RepID=UPI001F027185|nr:2Fe-2S iron-sulfur cluster-binding protein [Pseudonocardia sp. WMMC193]MCF7550859.1 2Fe-2S iron-sulfur cluster-binding protein [Pseudonocardia sp. WMMC193]
MTESFPISVEPLGRQVECRADQSILDACLRAGVWLPHACTHGTCGTCKVEIVEGEVEHNDASSYALMDFERSEGKGLICVATPRSAVTIEADVDAEDGIETHPVVDHVGTVARIDDCGTDIRRVVLDLDGQITFNPGQYVQVTVPGQGVTRSWSMANPPGESGRVELNIRLTPGGLATEGWVFRNLAVGDRLELAGPYGRFFLRPTREEPMVLIGGGTGLAPLKSIVRHVLASDQPRRMYLYHGARTEGHLYDRTVFEELEQAHPESLSYRPCVSDEEVPGVRHGLVTDAVERDFETLRGHVAYLCGPPPMVEAALKSLMRKRLFPRDIYREDFFDMSDKNGPGGLRSPLLRSR